MWLLTVFDIRSNQMNIRFSSSFTLWNAFNRDVLGTGSTPGSPCRGGFRGGGGVFRVTSLIHPSLISTSIVFWSFYFGENIYQSAFLRRSFRDGFNRMWIELDGSVGLSPDTSVPVLNQLTTHTLYAFTHTHTHTHTHAHTQQNAYMSWKY